MTVQCPECQRTLNVLVVETTDKDVMVELPLHRDPLEFVHFLRVDGAPKLESCGISRVCINAHAYVRIPRST